jgi:hypothetical protein
MLDLATRISKEAGTAYRGVNGDSRAMPPIDKDDLEDIKQVINDGIRQFEADAPATGWEWRKRIIQVNISNLEITGTADAADSTSLTDATLETTYDSNDDLNGYWCYITGGTGEGSYAQITTIPPLVEFYLSEIGWTSTEIREVLTQQLRAPSPSPSMKQ